MYPTTPTARRVALGSGLALQQLEPLPQGVRKSFRQSLDVVQQDVQGEGVLVEVAVEDQLPVRVAGFSCLENRRISFLVQNCARRVMSRQVITINILSLCSKTDCSRGAKKKERFASSCCAMQVCQKAPANHIRQSRGENSTTTD